MVNEWQNVHSQATKYPYLMTDASSHIKVRELHRVPFLDSCHIAVRNNEEDGDAEIHWLHWNPKNEESDDTWFHLL